jgi:XisI protein
MDKLQQYRQIIQQVLNEQAHPYCHSNDVETEIICDTEHDHYQLTYIGREEQKRIFNLHFALHFLRHILVTKTRPFSDTTDRNSSIAAT